MTAAELQQRFVQPYDRDRWLDALRQILPRTEIFATPQKLAAENTRADVVAHLGGFVTGWLLGLVLARVSRFTRRPQVNLIAGILYALLIIIPWFLALSAR